MANRRSFLTLLGSSAAAWPLAARAQQRMPVVGYLSSVDYARSVAGFRKGLSDEGYVEARNVIIEYRFANMTEMYRLTELAVDLVRRQVAVIATGNSSISAMAAKEATRTIPIVFSVGGDPVKMGLVASLSKPGGNMTGVSFLATDTAAKMLEMLREAVPIATVIALLVNPTNPQAEAVTKEVQEAARILGLDLMVLSARDPAGIDAAFATLVQQRAAGLLIEGDPFFTTQLKLLAALSLRHAIPAIYQGRDFPEVGGLMSYGADRVDASRIVGVYTGRVLKGEKPGDLPVQLSTRVELIINLTTAKALGLTFPITLLGRADEAIE
jgi:putative ABC transport system substrate-binding protein